MSETLDMDDPVGEACLLHGRHPSCIEPTGDEAYFSIFRKFPGLGEKYQTSQRTYRMPMLEPVVRAARGSPDVYISQSTFERFSRKARDVKQLRACWVDLDLYTAGKSPDSSVIASIISHGESLGLPVPSSVIHSGRGAYLKWYLDKPVRPDYLPAWKALQATLTSAYKCLSADAKARDISRVFRILHSVNSKSGGRVHRLDGSARLYEFVDLCEAAEGLRQAELPVQSLAELEGSSLAPGAGVVRSASAGSSVFRPVIEGAQRGDPSELLLYSELRQPIMMQLRGPLSLSWKRFLDLRDLAIARGGIAVGERDTHMFWMLNELAQARVVRSTNFESEARALLRAFPRPDGYDPLADGSMQSLRSRLQLQEQGVNFAWRGAPSSPVYTPSNALLISTFGITPEEMATMRTLISPEVAYQRRLQRLDEKFEGRAHRRNVRRDLREAVGEAFAQAAAAGEATLLRFNLSAFAKQLSANRSAVSRLWKQHLEQSSWAELADARKRNKITGARNHPLAGAVTSDRAQPASCPESFIHSACARDV